MSRKVIYIFAGLIISLTQVFGQNPLDQRINYSASDVSVEYALDEISNLSSYTFSYSSSLLAVDQKISIRAVDAKLSDVLYQCVGPGYKFLHRGSYIVIAPEKNTNEGKDKIEFKGIIKDASNGELITDATVYEVEDLSLASSDSSGNYALNLNNPKETVLLSVSRKNYKDTIIELDLRENDAIDLTLQLDPIGEAPDISPTDELKFTKFIVPKINIKLNQNVTLTEERDFQISFLPFLGTNGKMSGQISNKFSFNILGGYSKGLNGVEIGGFTNIDRENIKGFQFAGFANVVGGKTEGVQFSGFGNWTHDRVIGTQIAGFFNWSSNSVRGAQVTGGVNISDTVHGAQVSSISNFAQQMEGPQITAVSNISAERLVGPQISAVNNLALKEIDGAQITAVVNYANRINGAQISLVSNVAEEIKGPQVSLLFNYAQKMDGVQIGLFNYADSIKSGAAIGLISWVKSGLHRPEISYDDLFPFHLRFVSGTEKFYNILLVGGRFTEQEQGWTFGYGFGSQFSLGRKFYTNLELTALQYSEFEDWVNAVNIVGDLSWNFGFRFTKNTSIHAGPVLRTYISQYANPKTGEFGNLSVENPFYTYKDSNISVQSWIGYRITLRI